MLRMVAVVLIALLAVVKVGRVSALAKGPVLRVVIRHPPGILNSFHNDADRILQRFVQPLLVI